MLITAIVMVVVLAVALTTSSLAWFSATQNNVTASGGSFTASTATGKNVNIAISDTIKRNGSSSMTLATPSIKMAPACLNQKLSETLMSEDNSNAQIKLDTAQINRLHFKAADIKQEVLTLDVADSEGIADTNISSGELYYYDAIYIQNNDEVNLLDKITVTIESKIEQNVDSTKSATPVALLRLSRSGETNDSWTQVDCFVAVLDGSGNYTVYDLNSLKGLEEYSEGLRTSLAKKETIECVVPTIPKETDNTKNISSYTFDFTKDGSVDGLAAGCEEWAKLDILMWFDGCTLDASSQQTLVNFDIKIEGSNS